ncbi:hypothetical protein MASR1M65_21460 [Saprospiraceae bacterium]
MKKLCIGLLSLVMLLTAGEIAARENPNQGLGTVVYNKKPSKRGECKPSTSSTDLNINNVRARLLGGGDMWWDLKDPKYIVPNVEPGKGIPEVSSLFSGAVWLGGFDDGGNLKMAAQTHRSSGNDFWPGPLTSDGLVEESTCAKWDRHFTVYGKNIKSHIDNFKKSIDPVTGENKYDPNTIPADVKGWPSRGNPYFEEINGFSLPDDDNGLAGFHDAGTPDFEYDPKDGDYPVIEIRGCELTNYPDQMVFWIYNDAGGVHTQTNGDAIKMEVQVQAFAYASNDELNDMTFYRFKLINRAIEPIDSTFFAMWTDPDLGCATDDYIGCDTSRSLMYIYNQDAIDGDPGTNCGGTPTYNDKIPMLGIDYFRGPNDENGNEIGMSSFIYYNNGGIGNNPPGTEDPNGPIEHYRYLSGSWRDGKRITKGGSGYNTLGTPTKYTFPEAPNDPNGWSMCTANLGIGDRRTLQASGPFRLDPGKKNELIIGVVWVPNIPHPCPNPAKLTNADDLAQALFNNCFKVTDGPDAPDVDFIELNNQLVMVLTNDSLTSNNAFENYSGVDLRAPEGTVDSLYRFEGYKIYQVAGSDVTNLELNDPEKAQLIAQYDLKNGVTQIFNWNTIDKPNSNTNEKYWIPTLKVVGQDLGIKHTLSITEDVFAKGDRKLINHKQYYFKVVAYAYNNYEKFDPITGLGQRTPYLEGRRVFTAVGIPRPIIDVNQNAEYGTLGLVSRVDGNGTGGFDLEISDDTRSLLFEQSYSGDVPYLPGRGPIDVKIYNPVDTKKGEFILTFVDSDMSNNKLDVGCGWTLKKVDDPSFEVLSEESIDRLNEQVIAKFGFSITIGQIRDAGTTLDAKNGFVGTRIKYAEGTGQKWLVNIPNTPGVGPLHYIKTNVLKTQWNALDPKSAYINDLNIYPYILCDYVDSTMGFISPAWQDLTNKTAIAPMKLSELNNVDIVFTKDKSKWSRCVVIETTPKTLGEINTPIGNAKQFDLRKSPSVGKDDADGDGLPDTDGDGDGMGWFPGYAVDVETGQRLNIFFGEASAYAKGAPFDDNGTFTGGDMMFNPSNHTVLNNAAGNIYDAVFGGLHTVYVTKSKYDGCDSIRTLLKEPTTGLKKVQVIRKLTWTFMPFFAPETQATGIGNGIIPNDCVVSARVDNIYHVANQRVTDQYKGYPSYKITILGANETTQLTDSQRVESLDNINIVPNPYYAYSAYETSQFTNTVKITNLPNKCTVTIYSLDGKFIRQYKRDEVPGSAANRPNAPFSNYQVVPDLNWDMRNDKGVPIGSGVYLIHVDAPGVGERTLKWFGVGRQFDPSGL